jgi:hypothetical protein
MNKIKLPILLLLVSAASFIPIATAASSQSTTTIWNLVNVTQNMTLTSYTATVWTTINRTTTNVETAYFTQQLPTLLFRTLTATMTTTSMQVVTSTSIQHVPVSIYYTAFTNVDVLITLLIAGFVYFIYRKFYQDVI